MNTHSFFKLHYAYTDEVPTSHFRTGRQERCRSACRRIFVTGATTRLSTSITARAGVSGTSTVTSTSITGWPTGPIILGYADERVDAAARREGMEIGGVFALSTELEYQVAKSRQQDGARGRARAVLELGYRGGHGGATGLRERTRVRTGILPWRAAITACLPRSCGTPNSRNGTRKGDPRVAAAYGDGVPEITKDLCYTVPLNDANVVPRTC